LNILCYNKITVLKLRWKKYIYILVGGDKNMDKKLIDQILNDIGLEHIEEVSETRDDNE